MANRITNADNDKDERTIQKVNDILDAVADCIVKRVHSADPNVERHNLVGIVDNCLVDLTRAKLLLWEGMGICPYCHGEVKLVRWEASRLYEGGWCHWECTNCHAQFTGSMTPETGQ